MTRSQVTLRAVLLGMALGLLCCWWMLRTETTAPPEREVARATGAAVEGERLSRPRARDAAIDAPVDPTPVATPAPPRRVVFHVVATEDESPIAGAGISDWYAHPTTFVTTDAAGDATFDAPATLENGWACFRVEAPNRVRADAVFIEFKGLTECRRTVEMDPGFAVDGLVLGHDGSPLARARCSVWTSSRSCGNGNHEILDARADDEGRLHVDGLPLGTRLSFRFSEPRHLSTWIVRREHDASFLDVRLEAAGLIRGIVRGPDGRPLGGARVSAHDAGRAGLYPDVETRAASGDDGRFEIGGLAFGVAWRIVAAHPDFVDAGDAPTVELTPSDAEAVRDVVLRPPTRLEVVFTGPDAEERSGTIGAEWPGGNSYFNPCVVPGRATLQVGKSGTCRITVDVPGLRVAHAAVEIGSGDSQTVEVRLESGGTIAGTAVDDVGAPVGGASITIRSDYENRSQTVRSGADGSFRAEGLDRGTHDVSATASGHGAFRSTDVVAQANEPLRVVLPRDGVAAGTLRLPDGARRATTRRITWEDKDYFKVGDDEAWTSDEFAQSLAPGKWAVLIAVPGHVDVAREVDVHPGRRIDLGTIALAAEAPFVGRVVDGEGRPLRGATVWVDGTPGKWTYRHADADAEGRFTVPGLAAGEYPLRVVHDDFVDVKTKLALTDDAAPLVVTLHRGAVLRVRLRGPDEKSLRTFSVFVDRGADTTGIEVLDQESPGRFSERLASGAWRVRVERLDDDATTTVREVELRDGEDKSIEVDLPK